MYDQTIILASASPRRAEILRMAGVSFKVHPANIVEVIKEGLAPKEVTLDIAKQKMQASKHSFPNEIILTSDTIVVLGDEILGKPQGVQEALEMLQKLSGQMHEVITGVVLSKGSVQKEFTVSTKVYFKRLSKATIDHYIEQDKPFDKAGSYAIQEFIGAVGIEKIEGDYYNVVGLPISRVIEELQQIV